MFKISTYLVEFCSGDERHISLDDSLKLREVFKHKKFTPEYIQLHVIIQYNHQIIVGNDIPSGLDLWEQTYTSAVEGYLDERKVEIMYGTLESLKNKLSPGKYRFIQKFGATSLATLFEVIKP